MKGCLRQLRIWKTVLVTLAVLAELPPANSQRPLINRWEIGTDDGLASRHILSIIQDSKGFIWLATSEGIQRYDGYEFRLFRRETHGLSSNQARRLAEDREGRIWAISYEDIILNGIPGRRLTSIDIIDPGAEKVQPFTEVFSGRISFGLEDIFGIETEDDGGIWISTRSGQIFRYGRDFEQVAKLPFPAGLFMPAGDRALWVVRKGELLEVDLGGRPLDRDELPFVPAEMTRAGSAGIFLSAPDNPNYAKSRERRLCYKEAGKPLRYHFPLSGQSADFEGLDGALVDRHGRLWTYDSGDVSVYLGGDERVERIPVLEPGEQIDLPVFFFDRNNFLWLFYSGRLRVVEVRPNPFKVFLEKQGFSIRGMIQLGNKRLLVNTYHGTIELDLASGRYRRLEIPFFTGLGLWRAPDGSVWSGSHNSKVVHFDGSKAGFSSFFLPSDIDATGRMDIYTGYFDDRGRHWLGTSKGLIRFNSVSGLFRQVRVSSLNRTTVYWIGGEAGGLWIGTDRGLMFYDPQTRQVERPPELPRAEIMFVYRKGTDDFWIATRGLGLLHWNRATHSVRGFGSQAGLLSNVIYAIHEDEKKHLWLSSRNGLIRFDPLSGQGQTFSSIDGLPENEFNYLAHQCLQDSTLVFGGINGIIGFKPGRLRTKSILLFRPLVVTHVDMLNRNSGNMEEWTRDFQTRGQLRVPPQYTAIQVQVSMLNFLSPGRTTYAYRVKGLGTKWIFQNSHIIRLGSLPYGSYGLEIRSQGTRGAWSDNTIQIPIQVMAPFYRTWQFQVPFALALIMLVGGSGYGYVLRLRRDKALLDREVVRRTAQIERDKQTILRQYEELDRLYRVKDRLFTIIGHELRGPVIGLQGLAAKVAYYMERGEFEKAKTIGTLADETTSRMRLLLDNLLSWGRAQRGNLIYNPGSFEPGPILEEAIEFHQQVMNSKGVNLRLEIEPGTQFFFDRNALRIIALNLIANSVKFTPSGGEICVKAGQGAGGWAEFSVSDTGIGIDPEHLEILFKGRYESRPGTDNEKGVGIGLTVCYELVRLNHGRFEVNSSPGEGSVFRVWVPSRQEVAEQEESQH